MATLEITTTLVVAASGWLVSTITATWALSRRSKGWDDAENHEEVLYGNRRTSEAGLIQRVKTLEGALTGLADRFKLVVHALDAHGSGEHQIAEGVRRRIREHATEAYEEIVSARRKLLEDQGTRFALRPEGTFPNEAEDDPFTVRPGQYRRLGEDTERRKK